MPNIPIVSEKVSANFLKSQLQSWFQPTDNRLAMKLFGSRKALVKERIRQKTSGHWVIHPCSSFRYRMNQFLFDEYNIANNQIFLLWNRFYWDLCMLLLLVANLIILPVAISFFNDDLSTRWIAFNCLSDTIFLIDIVVNFRTGNVLSLSISLGDLNSHSLHIYRILITSFDTCRNYATRQRWTSNIGSKAYS